MYPIFYLLKGDFRVSGVFHHLGRRWASHLTRGLRRGPQDLGGCQKYGPFLGTLNIRCRTIPGTQKGTIILTTTHLSLM